LGKQPHLWWLSLCKVNFKHWVYFLLPIFVFPHCILCLMFEVSTFKRSIPMLNKWILVCLCVCMHVPICKSLVWWKRLLQWWKRCQMKVFERCMSALVRPSEFPPRIKGHLNYNINQRSNKCSAPTPLLLIEEFKLYCMLILKLLIYLLSICEVLLMFAWRRCWRNVRLGMLAFVP
jgi:hypothetical protein